MGGCFSGLAFRWVPDSIRGGPYAPELAISGQSRRFEKGDWFPYLVKAVSSTTLIDLSLPGDERHVY